MATFKLLDVISVKYDVNKFNNNNNNNNKCSGRINVTKICNKTLGFLSSKIPGTSIT
jgi:hypothetical protein